MTPAGLARLKLDEGLEGKAYPDPDSPLGKACASLKLAMRDYQKVHGWASFSGSPWTIGYGCTGAGIGPNTIWTQAQADAAIASRVQGIETRLNALYSWFDNLPPVRADVLTNIAYNVGLGELQRWHTTLGHFEAHDWPAAAHDLRTEGQWNIDVGARAERLAVATETGVWG